MNDVAIGILMWTAPTAILAWLCRYISRPFLQSKVSKILSQSFAVLLLLFSYGVVLVISPGISQAVSNNFRNVDGSQPISFILSMMILVFFMKFVSMYLISSYAKSTGKTPYWSFIAVLNIAVALFFMARWLWKTKPKEQIV